MDVDPKQLETYFVKYMKNIKFWLPEGITDVNLALLHKMGLLNYYSSEFEDHPLTRYFHVIESSEKITLVNDQFIIWIVPEKIKNVSTTYTFIALNQGNVPHLEIAFSTWGVYNTSRLVLRILEKYLSDIQENEDYLAFIKKDMPQSS